MLCRSGIKSKESSILHEHKIPAGVLPEVPAGKQRAVLLSWRFMAELHLFVRASFTVQVTVSTVSYRPQRLRKHFLDFSNLSQDFIYIYFFSSPNPALTWLFLMVTTRAALWNTSCRHCEANREHSVLYYKLWGVLSKLSSLYSKRAVWWDSTSLHVH